MSENIKVTFDTAEEDLHVNLDAGAIMYGKMQIGTTTTGESGTEAKVENVGSQTNAILNFTIPKGDKGEQGEKGEKGDTGSPVEVKDIPANTNVDEFFEEGTYAWNGDDGKAITGLPNDIVDMPSFSYMLKITKHSTMTNEKNKFEHYFQEFWLEGMFIYTRKITVRTGLETGRIFYERYSWERQALVNYDGVTVSSTEPTVETEKSKVWLQKGKNLFNKNGTTIIDQYIDGGTGEIKTYANGTKMFVLEVQPSTSYTISKTQGGHFRVGTTNNYPSVGTIVDGLINNGSATSITITTNSTAKYLCCSYWQTGVDTITEESMRESIQVERGLSATAYEEAITSAIYTKESNNKYEKFTETVAISSHQPTNQNGLWLQKGKNLFDGKLELGGYDPYNNGKKLTASDNYRNANPIRVESSTTYTLSIDGVAQKYIVFFYDGEGKFLSHTDVLTGTFKTPTNCKYLNFRCFAADFTSDFASLKVQLELGSTATEYEEYVDKKIYTKNDNGVYEEFINADEVKNDYSLGERRIGTWIDGKPLYRKVIQTTAPTVSTDGTFSSNGTVIADGVTNAIIEWGYVVDTDNQNMYLPYTTNNGYIIKCFINSSKALYLTSNGTSFSNKTVIISVLYTKTTDVATTSEE